LSIAAALRRELSTATADAAPRDTASNAKAPVPAKRSRNRAPRMRSPTMLKYA
jgi:hypothetical protein